MTSHDKSIRPYRHIPIFSRPARNGARSRGLVNMSPLCSALGQYAMVQFNSGWASTSPVRTFSSTSGKKASCRELTQ
eukprot:75882-Heterocapsa_arctica.AAC.1